MDLEKNFETRDFEIELLKGARIAETQVFVSVSICMFQDQTQSDAVIEDVSCMIGCNCSSFIFIAAKKGAVVGRLTFSGFDSVKKNLGWVEELNLIVKTKQKAEIQL